MAWYYQATCHYLSQCWPRSMSPYVINRPEWVTHWWCNNVAEINGVWLHNNGNFIQLHISSIARVSGVYVPFSQHCPKLFYVKKKKKSEFYVPFGIWYTKRLKAIPAISHHWKYWRLSVWQTQHFQWWQDSLHTSTTSLLMKYQCDPSKPLSQIMSISS